VNVLGRRNGLLPARTNNSSDDIGGFRLRPGHPTVDDAVRRLIGYVPQQLSIDGQPTGLAHYHDHGIPKAIRSDVG
jgi:hypothetical protein